MLIWRSFRGMFRGYVATKAERDTFRLLASFSDTRYQPIERDYALKTMNETESQAGTLLSHISIMIAVTGVIWAFNSQGLLRTVLAIELVGYLILALLCIRCQLRIGRRAALDIDAIDHSKVPGQGVDRSRELVFALFDEALFRDRLLRFCIPVLYVLTVVLIGTLIAALLVG
ncbi:hypothetical protein GTA62_10165 [Roseobacter sp. HKCCD9010]|nr:MULTISPECIES: hypothetical protein [unclassified Roseobacter]MBF9050927.1 hypothetical protein [Rhodobacterales bacterium HKCCD4356]NNV77333.1 hypothetical protein [Roseobacter sp. HKCCD6135]NNV86202.1 hypothetical protein [Roseobacter sp. HKCCD8414]NNW07451.1 hypothetical protein [Roseobacter sp. HKCCD8431]NNW54308.1 hypothetical protein [Roseobacter sp. HKCCD8284]NNX77845.1 hypothetical protein [Roseobacter sp. HKCCD8481]NNY60655.1 hypothetical protein [Roseobacter sp. HKCCD8499]NNY734